MSRNSGAGDTHTLEHRLALPAHPMAVSGMDEERRQQTRTHESGLLEDAPKGALALGQPTPEQCRHS